MAQKLDKILIPRWVVHNDGFKWRLEVNIVGSDDLISNIRLSDRFMDECSNIQISRRSEYSLSTLEVTCYCPVSYLYGLPDYLYVTIE